MFMYMYRQVLFEQRENISKTSVQCKRTYILSTLTKTLRLLLRPFWTWINSAFKGQYHYYNINGITRLICVCKLNNDKK